LSNVTLCVTPEEKNKKKKKAKHKKYKETNKTTQNTNTKKKEKEHQTQTKKKKNQNKQNTKRHGNKYARKNAETGCTRIRGRRGGGRRRTKAE